MDKREILDKIVRFYTGGNYTKFSLMLGLEKGTASSWKYRGNFDVDLISAKCREINYQFLLTGEGPMLRSEDDNYDNADKITKVTNELLLVCAELKKQITDIRQELEEERRQHAQTTALLNRVLDLYTRRMDADYIRKAQDQYRTLAAETDMTENSEAV